MPFVTPLTFRLALLATAAFLAGPLTAQTTLTVDATKPLRYVDDRQFGVNAVMWDGKTSDPQTIAMVRAAGLRMIRIPGGSLSDTYNWTTNKSGTNNWSWSAGTDAFVALVTGAGTQTTCVANYGTGTPEEAAAWVAYLNAPASLQGTSADVTIGTDAKGFNWQTAGYWSNLRAAAKLGTDDGLNFLRLGRVAPVGVKSWEVGNECYGTWEADEQAVPHDPYTYAVRTKDYIAKMKAVDPTIRISVVVVTGEDQSVNNRTHPVTNPRTSLVHYGWTPVVLATLKSLGVIPDALVYHRYEQGPGNENDATLLQLPKSWATDAADLRQQLSDYLGADGSAVELVVTENNSVYEKPGKQSTSVVSALFYADALGNILQTEFNEFVWWALRNGTPTDSTTGALVGNISSSLYGWRLYGDYGVISMPNAFGQTSSFEGYPAYYAMKLVSNFARGGDRVVTASSTSSLLAVYAVKRTNGTLTLLVINKSPTTDTSATITVAGFTPKATATVYSYGIPQDEAAHTGTGSPDIASTTLGNAGASFTATFTHYSASVVTLAQAAPVIAVQPTAGPVSTGANVTLAVAANGYAPLTYQWSRNGVAISGATGATLPLSNVTTANAGDYSVVVTDAGGASVTSGSATLSVTADTYVPRAAGLLNLSTRAQVGINDNVMIAGFVLGGTGSKKVLIRAVGPGLNAWITGTLADPQLVVTKSDGTYVAENDNWGSVDAAAITAANASVGAFNLTDGSKDAAIILTLPAGGPTGFSGYTVTVKGANGGTGVALVEVYDLEFGSPARLVNISTRAQVGTGAQAMIGGFALRGTGSKNILVRAVGPTLGQWIGGVLADPLLTLTKPDGTPIAVNDNWGDTNAAAIRTASAATGGFALIEGSKDSALLMPLNAGTPPTTFTPKVEGNAGTTGVALMEAYEAP